MLNCWCITKTVGCKKLNSHHQPTYSFGFPNSSHVRVIWSVSLSDEKKKQQRWFSRQCHYAWSYPDNWKRTACVTSGGESGYSNRLPDWCDERAVAGTRVVWKILGPNNEKNEYIISKLFLFFNIISVKTNAFIPAMLQRHYPVPVVVLRKICKIRLYSCNRLLIRRKTLTIKEDN